jgi:hypothetical protein
LPYLTCAYDQAIQYGQIIFPVCAAQGLYVNDAYMRVSFCLLLVPFI